MKYLIGIIPGQEDFELRLTHFIEELRKQWPDVVVQHLNDPFHQIEWEIPGEGDQRIDGYLAHDGSVAIEASSTERCVPFALWYRTFIPPEQRVLFCDIGYHASIELHMDTTAPEIIQAMLEGQYADLEGF